MNIAERYAVISDSINPTVAKNLSSRLLSMASKTRMREREEAEKNLDGPSRGLAEILPNTAPKLNADFCQLLSNITTMAALPTMRQLGCLRALLKTQEAVQPQIGRRFISTIYSQRPERVPLPPNLPKQFLSQLPVRMQPENGVYLDLKRIPPASFC